MSNKIVFKEVRAKNFRSIGNMPMSIDLCASPKTLIVSNDNGAGKSTLIIWSIYYALYGRPYKKEVKVASLVNSRSGKDCLVELDFEAKGSKWTVRRGQKPAIFDILRDGVRVEDEAATKDYQAYLLSIIGMDDKAFEFIVALGPDKFVPFSQMKASERRNFVEQVLDITIISQMNEIAKMRLKLIKKDSDQAFYDIGMTESKLGGHNRTLSILIDRKSQRLTDSKNEIDKLKVEETSLVDVLEKTSSKTQSLKEKFDQKAEKRYREVEQLIGKFKLKVNDINSYIKNFRSIHTCQSCLQEVTESHKDTIVKEREESLKKLEDPLKVLEDELEVLKKVLVENREIENKISKINSIGLQANAKLSSVRDQIKSLESKMVNSNEDELIDSEKKEISRLEETLKEKSSKLESLKASENEHEVLIQTLKDDAAKAEIVRQYLPFLNQKINDYLDSLNLYVQLSLDEEFNMEMFAPDRKNQTIDNLSTGQLRRVDLAVLLSWREIAREKASVSTNLLVLDEILENLSQQGVNDFSEMWETKYSDKDINLFVVSQRNSEFEQYFDRTITYALKNDRTVEI